jgi:hypothetical protein
MYVWNRGAVLGSYLLVKFSCMAVHIGALSSYVILIALQDHQVRLFVGEYFMQVIDS